MRERSTENPLSQEVKDHLRSRVATEIDPRDKQIGAFVVASEAMLQGMLETGVLRNPTAEKEGTLDAFITQGFGTRLRELPLNENQRNLLADPEELRSEIEQSTYEAVGHYFLTRADIPLTIENQKTVSDYIADSDPISQLLSLYAKGTEERAFLRDIRTSSELFPHIPDDKFAQIRRIRDEAKERQGTLIGFSANLVDAMQVHSLLAKGDPTVPLSIRGGEGMSYRSIAKIEPLGKHERRFLQNL